MPPKPSNPAWKTGEQLEFLLSNWEGFKHAQNAKKLDHFWQRVFEAWYKRWPITPPPSSHSHEPIENQRLMAQRENNTVRQILYYALIDLIIELNILPANQKLVQQSLSWDGAWKDGTCRTQTRHQ